jgi:hypothetical protein
MENNPYNPNPTPYQQQPAPTPPMPPVQPAEPQQHQPHEQQHGHGHGHHHGHHGHDHQQSHEQHNAFQAPQPSFTPPAITPPTPLFPTAAPEPVAPTVHVPVESVSVMPQPVVKVLSPRGVEYVFMTIVLLTGAFSLAGILLSLVNGETSFEVLSFPAAVLTVCVPVFAWLFLRLKAAELRNPALKLDASKRRSTQFTQIAAFLVCFFTLIGFVTILFAKLSGNFSSSFFKAFLDVLIIEAVAGGILAYYWRDEHSQQ